LLCSSYFPLGQYFEQITGIKGKLGAGGSVATTAWDLARFLGARPVFMGGLDLGYPAAATHFKGAFFENAFHALSTRLQPAAALSFAYIMQADPFYTSSNGPAPVLTDMRMQVYRTWFQTQMQTQNFPTYNLSPAGVKIEGMPYKPLTELMTYPVIRPGLDRLLQQMHTHYCESSNPTDGNPADRQNREALMQALGTLEQDFSMLAALAAQGLEANKQLTILAAGHKNLAAMLDRLAHIDQEIMQLGSRQMAGFLLQPLIHETLRLRQEDTAPDRAGQAPAPGQAAAPEQFKRILTLSSRFYQELDQAARYHHSLIAQALTRMRRK
jgi:hypothetical protein